MNRATLKTAKALSFLRSKEWAMGNGQCDECCGLAPGKWFSKTHPHPVCRSKRDEGHMKGCKVAEAITSLGGKVVYRGTQR